MCMGSPGGGDNSAALAAQLASQREAQQLREDTERRNSELEAQRKDEARREEQQEAEKAATQKAEAEKADATKRNQMNSIWSDDDDEDVKLYTSGKELMGA